MKKALVTGANGFIGSAVVRELLNNDVEVIALARTVTPIKSLKAQESFRLIFQNVTNFLQKSRTETLMLFSFRVGRFFWLKSGGCWASVEKRAVERRLFASF